MLTNLYFDFLSLVRLGIGTSTHSGIVDTEDWDAIIALADRQGLCPILADGIEHLPQGHRPPKPIALRLVGNVLQNYEYRHEMYCRTIAELAGFYNARGYKMMVLKGYACSVDWPKPEHRPSGDIDIWQFGQQKAADACLSQEKGIEIDNSHHHHTVFFWRDFMVENHYDFINVHHHKSNVALEGVLKELGKDDSHWVELYGEKVYLPSPNLHSLFLLKHSMNDFTSFSITLRQVLDWGFHVKKYTKEIDWDWLLSVLKEYHMMDFFIILNAICVEDLGFETNIFPKAQFNPSLKDKVLEDIFNPKYERETPNRLIPRLLYKYKRWQGNSWKHKLCYKESMWSAFWSGAWNHLLKPSSI